MRKLSPHQLLNGIFFSQEQPTTGVVDVVTTTADWTNQEFYFPDDYRRGTETDEYIIPDFTGFQVLVDVAPGYADVASLDWRVQRYLMGTGWITEGEGTAFQAPRDGNEVWFDIGFDKPIEPSITSLTERWRFGVKGRIDTGPINRVVPYDGEVAIIDEHEEYIHLVDDRAHLFEINGVPSLLYKNPNDGLVYYSVQQGVEALHYTSPNPLANDFVVVTNAAEQVISNIALNFRLIGQVADAGIDFLGNQYRSAVKENGAANIDSIFGTETDTYWLSKPNPSRFAVESLYFDIRDSDDNAQVIDQVLLDPVTPNIYFHIYYSTDEKDYQFDNTDWEERIWHPIPKTFKASKRESHVFPEPVVAKFMKIEFSHLQPRPFAPGEFQVPIRYKKHPKWVLDYFLVRTEIDKYTGDGSRFAPRSVSLIYDALDLAYNYHLDDLGREPDAPVIINPSQRQQSADLLTSEASGADPESLRLLNLILTPYQQHPAFRSIKYLLSESAGSHHANYSTELADLAPRGYDTSALRSAHRDAVVYEASHPVMFYFIPCRHRYKEVEARFSYNRAYFVGVRQVAFSRERYTIANDTPIYIETMGDDVNMARNDFIRVEEGRYAVE